MSITGLTGVFGLHRQIGPSDDLTNPNHTAKGPYNAGIGGNANQTTVQTLTLTGLQAGNTYRLGFRGYVTAPIAYNATNSQIQSALEALTKVIEVGDVTVTGSGPFTISFAGGRYAGQPVGVVIKEVLVAAGASVVLADVTTGGRWYFLPANNVNFQPQQIVQAIPPEVGGDLWSRGSYKGGVHGEGQVMLIPRGGLGLAELFLAFTGTQIVSTTSTTNFGQVVNKVQNIKVAVSSGTISGGFTLTVSGQTTASISVNATAAQVRLALEALSNVEVGDVIVGIGGNANTGQLATAGSPDASGLDITWVGRFSGDNTVSVSLASGAGMSGTGAAVNITTVTTGMPMATKLVGNGSNGVQVGAYKYRFIPQSGAQAELPWYTLVRNVGGVFVEEYADARLGNFTFDLANTNVLNIDASFVSRAFQVIDPGTAPSSVGTQKAGGGIAFQAVDAAVYLDSNVGGAPGPVRRDERLNPTRLNIGFANQLSTNEHVVGSYFLQDITNLARTANVTYSVYLNSPELYMRTYANGASAFSNAAWSPTVWKGKLKTTLLGGYISGTSGDRYTVDVNIPEMDYMATPITMSGNNQVEYQLTTNVVLSQTPGVYPFYIDYTTDENIL